MTDLFKDEAEELWALFPRKVAKVKCMPKLRKCIERVGADKIRMGLVAYAKEVEGKDMEYVCHPQTWLNQERWDDCPAPKKKVKRADVSNREAYQTHRLVEKNTPEEQERVSADLKSAFAEVRRGLQ